MCKKTRPQLLRGFQGLERSKKWSRRLKGNSSRAFALNGPLSLLCLERNFVSPGANVNKDVVRAVPMWEASDKKQRGYLRGKLRKENCLFRKIRNKNNTTFV